MHSYSVVKDYTFEAAHRLQGHSGKCRNLHGHSYKLTVEVRATELINQPGESDHMMVMDFAWLDSAVKNEVDALDHHLLVPTQEYPKWRHLEHEAMSLGLDELNILPLEVERVTAEALAEFFLDTLKEHFADMTVVRGCTVTVWETAKSRAVAVWIKDA